VTAVVRPIRVVEGDDGLRLTLESNEAVWLRRERGWEDLQGDGALQPCVLGVPPLPSGFSTR
jgi:hypothetical protein